MQQSQFFDAPNFLDITKQINAFFVANPTFVGVSLSIAVYGQRCQAILLYTP